MKKNLVLVYVSASLLFSLCARAQQVCRWDVCEDTVMMQFDMERMLAAASPSDIAQIGLPTWPKDNDYGRVVRRSTDSGKTWRTLFKKTQASDRWNFVTHPTPNLYLVGADTEDYLGRDKNGNSLNRYRAYMMISGDGGSTWQQRYLDSNTYIPDLKMLNDSYGAALVLHDGNVYDTLPNTLPDNLLITTDGWKTWTTHPLPAGVRGCQHLFCFAPGVFGVSSWVTAASNYDSIDYLKTTDGGNTWQKIGTMPYVRTICFINENVGWGAGTNWNVKPQQPLIIHTTDGGATWTAQFDSNVSIMHWNEGLSQVAFADSLHGFASGSRLFETSDGGKTWNSNQPPFDVWSRPNGGMALTGLIMPSPTFALSTCGSPTIRYKGKYRLDAPIFNQHESGPIPVEPTTISWSRIVGADHYNLQLAVDPPWQGSAQKVFDVIELDTTVRDTFFRFIPRAGEEYLGRVRAIAEGDSSDWRWSGYGWNALVGIFKTVHRAGAALPPEIVSPANGSHLVKDLRVVWTSVPSAIKYHVDCWWDGLVISDSTTTVDTFAVFSKLQDNVDYFVTVKAILADDTTDPSAAIAITIDPTLTVQPTIAAQSLVAYPNPAHDMIHLTLPEEIRNSEFELYDLLGHSMAIDPVRETSGVRIDIHALPNGLYTLRIPGATYPSIRVLIQH